MNNGKPIRKEIFVSVGMGLQSSLLAIMTAAKDKRVKPYWDAKYIFADTMEEKQVTYEYRDNVLIPFLEDHGKELIQIDRGYRLYDFFYEENKVPLGWANPFCSSHFKRDLIHQYYRDTYGIPDKNGDKKLYGRKIEIHELIGITTDESTRAKGKYIEGKGYVQNGRSWNIRQYPFIHLDLSRQMLYSIYDEYGIKPAPSSACKLCPNLGLRNYKKLKKKDPEYYESLIELEVNAKQYNPSNPPTLLQDGSLIDLIEKQTSLEQYDWSSQQCDGGYCFT